VQSSLNVWGSWLGRAAGFVRFMASAAAVAYAIRLALAGEWLLAGAFVLLVVPLSVAPEFLERRRRRAIYRTGSVAEILEAALREVQHSDQERIALQRALALAALGVTGPARLALQAWRHRHLDDDEHEQLLIVEVLIEAFEGEHTGAHGRAAALRSLPRPESPGRERRSRAIRECMGAIVRAFDGRAEQGDLELLLRGPEVLPLLHWVTRYAAAAVCAQRGARDAVATLLEGAPEWPQDSAFALLHRDLTMVIATPMPARRVA
jgi:hypothetical protein